MAHEPSAVVNGIPLDILVLNPGKDLGYGPDVGSGVCAEQFRDRPSDQGEPNLALLYRGRGPVGRTTKEVRAGSSAEVSRVPGPMTVRAPL